MVACTRKRWKQSEAVKRIIWVYHLSGTCRRCCICTDQTVCALCTHQMPALFFMQWSRHISLATEQLLHIYTAVDVCGWWITVAWFYAACEWACCGVIQDRRQYWPVVHGATESVPAMLLPAGMQHCREGSRCCRPGPQLLVWSAFHWPSWFVDVLCRILVFLSFMLVFK